MPSTEFAFVRYRATGYGPHNKSGWFMVSAIYENASSGSPISPRNASDFKNGHHYWIQKCTCEATKKCEDMDLCPNVEWVRGFIVKLGGWYKHKKLERDNLENEFVPEESCDDFF